ncbi:MAG: hypothetical protein NUV98_00185 [Candidatus Roizmanbacteria bacterium]|nr:hypothetical protein [Candidatus Roizmanbacteria bacterium]
MKKIISWSDERLIFLLLTISVSLSVYAANVFISNGLIFANIDAATRLNTARRIFDNLTPGLAQIGGIWLPFPHILMLPFVKSDYLWRTGIAGWFISGSAYILSTIFVFKTLALMTKRNIIAFIGGLVFALNINVIFLQTTAMSEVFFIMCLCGLMYSFVKYIQTKSILTLLSTALFAFLGSLTRFEGFAVVIGSIAALSVYFAVHKQAAKKSEGTLILYIVPATLGMVMWSLYVWAIFGDPLYWLNYYGAIPSSATETVTEVAKPNILQANNTFWTSVIHMTGVLTFVMGIIGFIISLVLKEYRKYCYILFFPLFIFLFMIASLTRNTVIIQPSITWESFFDKSFGIAHEFNIRYGLSMLPFLIVFSFLMTKKSRILFSMVSAAYVLQVLAYFYTPLNLTYQLSSNWHYAVSPASRWMTENYDEGLILIAAGPHDREMIQFGLPYKTYIHEGTQKYWKESLTDPRKYATWIFMEYTNEKDPVTEFLKDSPILEMSYDLIYSDGTTRIYKQKS